MGKVKEKLQTELKELRDTYGVIYGILFLLLCGGILFVHFFNLAGIPYGINVDEMGSSYDAWCIAHFGVDRYLKSFPAYFTNFTSGNSAMYTYATAIVMKFMDFSVLAMRIVPACFALLTVFFGARIVLMKWGRNPRILLTFMGLYMIFPIFIMLARIGLDCNLMLGSSTVALYFICKTVQEPSTKNYLLSGIFCGLILYSYAVSYLIVPLFLLFMICYILWTRSINWKQFFAFVIPLGILALPLVLVQIVNMFDLPEMKLGFITITKLFQYRESDLNFSTIFQQIPRVWKSIYMYDVYPFTTLPRFFTMYVISIPFAMLGFFHFVKIAFQKIRGRERDVTVPILFWFLAEFLMGSCVGEEAVRAYRVNAIFLPVLIMTVDGLKLVYDWIAHLFTRAARVFAAVMIVAYGLFFGAFARYYFCDYVADTYPLDNSYFPFTEALDYLANDVSDEVEARTTYVGDVAQTYIFYIASNLMSPYEFHENHVIEEHDSQHLWTWANYYKNYDFNLPDTIDLNGNYIVTDNLTDYCERLEKLGFEKVHKGHYYVFTHPWESYTLQNESLNYTWNSGISEKNVMDASAVADVEGVPSIVTVGWAVNAEQKKCWDDAFLLLDGRAYRSQEAVERTDVAEQYGTEEVKMSGLLFIIPQADLVGVRDARFVCIDTGEEIRAEIPITIQ